MRLPIRDDAPFPRIAEAFEAPGTNSVSHPPKPAAGRRQGATRAAPGGAQLGLNRLTWRLIWLQLAFLAATAPIYPFVGVSIAWRTVSPFAVGLAVVGAAWAYHAWMPGSPKEWIVAEALAVVFLLVTLTSMAAPAQYAAIALRRPLIDPWLAAADAGLGVHVPALAAWTGAHRAVSWILTLAYVTLPLQLVLPVFVLGLMKRERTTLWEFCFHYHFCLIVTLVSLAVFPAVCAFNYYGFTATLDESRFTSQFLGARNGTLRLVRFDDLEGLISMPSFHAAAGLMVTWCCRRHQRWLAALCVLNALMIAATFMSGAHYFVDVIATLLLFLISVAVYRRWCAPLLSDNEPPIPVAKVSSTPPAIR
jgi:PAP2 superfamily protein